MAVIAGLLGAIVAALCAFVAMIAPLVWLGMDNYKGPGHTAITYGMVGIILSVFVIAFTGVKDLVARKIKSQPSPSENRDEPFPSKAEASSGQTRQKSFDVQKWNALLKYDQDIARVAEQLRPFGERWVDVFAQGYLALNDKQYLPSIVQKILSDAKREVNLLQKQRESDQAPSANEEQTVVTDKKVGTRTIWILVLGLLGLGGIIGAKEFFRTWGAHQALLQAEAEVRKQLPIRYKGYITLVDIKIGYLDVTYVNDVSDMALAQFSSSLSGLERDVRKSVCATDMKAMLSDGVSYSYVYRNSSNVTLADFTVASCP